MKGSKTISETRIRKNLKKKWGWNGSIITKIKTKTKTIEKPNKTKIIKKLKP